MSAPLPLPQSSAPLCRPTGALRSLQRVPRCFSTRHHASKRTPMHTRVDASPQSATACCNSQYALHTNAQLRRSDAAVRSGLQRVSCGHRETCISHVCRMYLANGRDWGDTLPRDITAVFKMARIVCVFMWFVHILGCLWNLVGLEGLEKQNWRYQYSQANSHFSEVPEWYLTSLYQTFLMMLGDQNAPVSNTEVRTNASAHSGVLDAGCLRWVRTRRYRQRLRAGAR